MPFKVEEPADHDLSVVLVLDVDPAVLYLDAVILDRDDPVEVMGLSEQVAVLPPVFRLDLVLHRPENMSDLLHFSRSKSALF
jgi:hypothetical protein